MRLISVMLCLIIVLFTGCGSTPETAETSNMPSSSGSPLVVYTSFYTMYDFASKIGGDKIEIHQLVPAGAEPHDWQPSAKQMKDISNADIVIYNGAGMESWIDSVMNATKDSDVTYVCASDGVQLLDTNGGIVDKEDKNQSYDPHVWLDPNNAKIEMENIANALLTADPEDANYFIANYQKYADMCDQLDAKYKEAVQDFTSKDVVVSHGAFAYLCNAYGLNQIPIQGISGESEPSTAQMANIVDYIKTNNINYIFVDEMESTKVADTVAKETGTTALTLNTIEGLTNEQVNNGEDYFSLMEENLQSLEQGLK